MKEFGMLGQKVNVIFLFLLNTSLILNIFTLITMFFLKIGEEKLFKTIVYKK